MKNWNGFVLLVGLFLFILTISLGWLITQKDSDLIWGKVAVCGTVAPYSEPIPESEHANYQIGKKIFKNNCAMCHNKNMVADMTGPALAGSFLRFSNDTLKFANYLRNPEQYLEMENDERLIQLHKSFGKIKKGKMENLSFEEIKNLIAFIEMKNY